jgi:hypothetical protein
LYLQTAYPAITYYHLIISLLPLLLPGCLISSDFNALLGATLFNKCGREGLARSRAFPGVMPKELLGPQTSRIPVLGSQEKISVKRK